MFAQCIILLYGMQMMDDRIDKVLLNRPRLTTGRNNDSPESLLFVTFVTKNTCEGFIKISLSAWLPFTHP